MRAQQEQIETRQSLKYKLQPQPEMDWNTAPQLLYQPFIHISYQLTGPFISAYAKLKEKDFFLLFPEIIAL